MHFKKHGKVCTMLYINYAWIHKNIVKEVEQSGLISDQSPNDITSDNLGLVSELLMFSDIFTDWKINE